MPMKKSTQLAQSAKPVKTVTVRYFRFFDFFVIILLLAIAAFSIYIFRLDLMQTINLRNVEPVGSVTIRKNIVQRRLANRVLWSRLATESPVYLGDLIRVADYSEATLNLKGNSVALFENTLIRIVLAPDGESIQIIMDEGSIIITPTEGSSPISLYYDGQIIEAAAGSENQRIEFSDNEIVPSSVVLTENIIPGLKSPVENSVFLFQEEPPMLHFQWETIDEAAFYILEVCDTPNFVYPVIRRQSQITYFADSGLGEGTWYWRVRPVFASAYTDEIPFSRVGNFRVEKSITETEEISFIEWLDNEIPPEIIVLAEPEPEPVIALIPAPVPPPPPAVRQPAPPSRLPAPGNLQPARGHQFTMEDLRTQRRLDFSWQAVRGANAYIFTIFQQTPQGRRQVFQTQPLNVLSFQFENLRILDRGTFIWQVEAVNRRPNGTFIQRGNPAESSFFMDIVFQNTIQVEGTGVIFEDQE